MLCIYIVLYCIVFYMYWRAPRLALVATWVIQSLQNKYVYIYITLGHHLMFAVCTCRWIPESPRWLAERGKLEECEKIVAIIAKKNNKTVDMASLKRFLKKQQAREECTKKYTYLDLFHSWKYTKRTIVLLISW